MNSHAMLSHPTDHQIRPNNVATLALKWSLVTAGGVSATPAAEPGGLYVPDWAGYIYKLNPDTGAVVWQHLVSEYTGLSSSYSRSAPAISGNIVVFGDGMPHLLTNTPQPGARMIAVDKTTGAKLWTTILDSAEYSEVLGSPVIYNNIVYIGTASTEEASAGRDVTFVPKFRGSMVALDLRTGRIIWKFYIVPNGYTGGASPGTTPVLWLPTHTLMFSTGNNYTIPASADQCVKAAKPDLAAMTACLDPTDYVEAVVALDPATGAVRWSRRMSGPDTYTMACYNKDPTILANCPYSPSLDFDFASQPNGLISPGFVGLKDDLGGVSNGSFLGVGQKSGVYFAMNPNTGGVFWSTFIGTGGIEWGSAVDLDNKNTVYVPLNNLHHKSIVLAGRRGVAQATTGGGYTAINLMTGQINWQIAAYGQDVTDPTVRGSAPGAVAFTNDLIFAGSSSGYFMAIDANSGATRWLFNSGDSIAGGAAIFNDTVFWGTGVKTKGTGKPTLFAFTLPAAATP